MSLISNALTDLSQHKSARGYDHQGLVADLSRRPNRLGF